MNKRFKFFPVFFVFAFLGFSLAVMLLWNALLPVLLGVSTISFLQAAGLLILSRLLFGGIGKSFTNMPAQHMGSRWMSMSQEERKEFANRFRTFNGFPMRHGNKNHEQGE